MSVTREAIEVPHELVASTGMAAEPSGSAWARWLKQEDIQRLTDHPLLRAFERGDTDLLTARVLLVQHYHYSRHFTRYLCALISKLSHHEDARRLMANLVEEMGLEREDRITHADLYQRTLSAVGASPTDFAPFEETRALVQAMTRYCQSEDSVEGLAALCLGAEAIVPLIYRPVIAALDALGFGDEAKEFFVLHVSEDEEHALTMLEILERLTVNDTLARQRAVEVGSIMVQRRIDLLDGVLNHVRSPRKTERNDSGARDHRGERAARPESTTDRYSSADFWRVPSRLTPNIPERLSHRSIMSETSHGAERFSGERRHKVHIVDLPSVTISMTIGRLTAREQTRLHRHNYETLIYIVAGKGYSRIGGRIVEWAAGDGIYVPVWAPHQHVSTTEEECVYLACENAPMLQNLGGIALREELGAAESA